MEENLIDEWLDRNGDPVVQRTVNINVQISNKLQDLKNKSGVSFEEISKATGIHIDEIELYFTGFINFDIQDIVQFELLFKEKILYIG